MVCELREISCPRDHWWPSFETTVNSKLLSVLLFSLVVATIAQSAAPVKSVWDGVYSKEQADRGKKAYNSLCARCHGETLLGNDAAKPLVGKEFLERWEGKPVSELVELTRTNMPSDGPGKLTRKQSTELATYVLSANSFPAGTNELAAELAILNTILIKEKK